VKTSSKILILLFVFVILLPQLYLIATGSSTEAIAGRMAFAVIPLLFMSLWLIGWVGRTIERIIKGRG
jgi:hypothetical protein